MSPRTDMSKGDSQRIQSSQAKGGKDMSSSGFASRAQSAGDRNSAGSGGNNQQGSVNRGNSDGQKK
ncbi:hypothetical protein LTR47_011301 [Exophiala xenobiotica]|nr:hypothetical protein LTR41_011837 [Exophiala xenobiotica]KAK5220274.1 hypothetical protein LTR47_011301 [Exophiala xenobiotica]KAK5244586.1 hypothetical protein LTS06_009853 [Exophiala xenobiotica]KAK5282510.1 hypothetical protein LTR40_003187 [Exophiala xenobiotica]KAK5344955.1 hypothetical protein LTR61_011294 [Exophiala xenobiotica]